MANAINLWVLDRLGLVFANFPNEFAKLTRDGYVLSQMLRSYDIINDDQLGLIKVSEDVNICNQNLMHLRHWLRTIDVTLDLSEITDIVKGRGTASLNIFYKVYLEVHNKERLNYTAQERLNEKLRPVSSFEVNTIEEPEVPLNFYENKLDSVIQYNYDIIHWHQDRLDTMIKKCKQAREQYNNELKKRRGSVLSTDFVATFNNLLDEKDGTEVLNLEQSLNIPYDELCRERKDAKEMVPFIPKLEESMKILKNIRTRQQNHSKEAVLKKQLHKQVLNDFFQSIKQEENDVFRETITEKLIKQSCYEKQMIKKLGEAKMQKEIMLENKQKIADAIVKEKEQEFIEQLLQENKELNNKELQYYLDKERALQLHKRLYEEKLRKRAERHRTLCHDIVEDICNLAMKEAEYKQFYGEGPNESVRNQWKNAFIAGVSPDDFVVPIENIVKEPEQDEEMESIVEKEINRQNAIDQQDLNNYLNFRWPWELANINVDENQIYEMNCGMNVLSNIVYRALETKYPAPTHRPRPNFPELTVVAFVNGLNDLNCIALLQKLLEHRNIIVCEIQDGVTYCVDAYQSEIKIEEDTDTIDVPPEDNREEESKPKTKNKKRKQKGEKRKSKKGKAEVNPPAVENVFTKVNKISQTPKLFPCEEIPLSQKAELGKLAQEQLTQGLTLTTHLLIDMFIEYLLSKPDMKGWVLLNYPTNYEEAVFLEEALSGVPVPEYIQKNNEIESFSEVNFLNFIQSEPEMEVKHFRDSQLLKKVPKRYEDPFYKTSMTAVVRMIHQEEKKTEDIETEINIVEQEKPNSLMEQFYADAGCLYSMYYTTFDFTALKYLAKLIIGDYTIPPKTSIELFGDTIKYINAEMMYTDADTVVPSSIASSAKEKPKKQQLKLKKTESSSPEKEEKAGKKDKDKGKGKSKGSEKGKGKGKGKKTGKVVIVREDKWTQIPEEEVEIIEVDVLPEPPEPGELEWDYLNLTLREDFEINLATLWENTEECYVEDMKQVFFMKRVLLNNVEPFVHYVRTHMREHITKPDEKQIYLRNFQTFFNEFDEDIRSDEEFKAEIHCRVHEMKEKLLNICEQRLLETERQRVSLIKTMWPPTHILHFINTYVSSFQLEIDRFVDTLVFVNDYYAGTITNMPCGEILGKESLPRLQIDSSIQEKISKLLISIEEECEDRNPFITKINNIANKCMAFVEKGYQTSSEMINKFKSIFEPKPEKRNQKRYSAKNLPRYPTCGHRKVFQGTLLTMRDIKSFHEGFYCEQNKGKQDAFSLKYCRAKPPNPKRKKLNSLHPKTTQFEYTISNEAGVNMTMCRESFLNVFGITKHRVIGVFKRFKDGPNHVPVETRGGDRKKDKFQSKKDAVIEFIKNLKACESHYARGKSNRVYLPSELNISKLSKMFNNIVEQLKVKESFFRHIFNTNFNIAFSAPAVDECSTCLELKQRIQIEKNDTEKSTLTFKFQLHQKQAKSFFDFLKKKPDDCFIMSFDCQKNLVLPKVSDQIAYYSRQLYCYNLSVVKGVSTDSLTSDNVSIYSWTENEARKSSSEVASIIFNELNTINLENYSSIRLVADGCAGQNKNVNILCMCGKWLKSYAPENISKLGIIYPVTGHSFLPSDRVFGLIERDLKQMKTIIRREEYHEVFQSHGTVKLIERDWAPYNWKEEATMHIRTANQMHFKISQCRRVSFRKSRSGNILVKGELAYNLDTARERTVCKPGKIFENVNPLPIPIGVQLKAEKLKDVEKLLDKHFGSEWRMLESLQWYVSVIGNANGGINDEGSVGQEEECECIGLGDSEQDNVVIMSV